MILFYTKWVEVGFAFILKLRENASRDMDTGEMAEWLRRQFAKLKCKKLAPQVRILFSSRYDLFAHTDNSRDNFFCTYGSFFFKPYE